MPNLFGAWNMKYHFILDQILQYTPLMKLVVLMMRMIIDIKQYFFPQMKQLQGDRQQEEKPFQRTGKYKC